MFSFDDNDDIDHLLSAVSKHVSEKIEQAKIKGNSAASDSNLDDWEREWIETDVSDDIYFYESINPLAADLAIVALYKKVEEK